MMFLLLDKERKEKQREGNKFVWSKLDTSKMESKTIYLNTNRDFGKKIVISCKISKPFFF